MQQVVYVDVVMDWVDGRPLWNVVVHGVEVLGTFHAESEARAYAASLAGVEGWVLPIFTGDLD